MAYNANCLLRITLPEFVPSVISGFLLSSTIKSESHYKGPIFMEISVKAQDSTPYNNKWRAKQVKIIPCPDRKLWCMLKNHPTDLPNNCFGEVDWVGSGVMLEENLKSCLWTFLTTASVRRRPCWCCLPRHQRWQSCLSQNSQWIGGCRLEESSTTIQINRIGVIYIKTKSNKAILLNLIIKKVNLYKTTLREQ